MKHILVVDDVINDLKCAEEILRDIYQVTTVDTGEKALLFLEENMPDLILLDVDMPAMNGYEVMEQLKQDEVFSGIPVVFFIEGSDRENEIRCLKMGAMDFIKKPFEPELMLSRIGRILKLTEQNKILQDIARKDGLTDLLNRRYMEKLLNLSLIHI